MSVIIIFLNAERFLEEAIQSVLGQTYRHWELLLVDDGSTDASTDIALGHARAGPGRVRYVDHAHHRNRGMSASRNTGIRHARGAHVAFLDADDVWFPEKLAHQVALLQAHPGAAMVYGPVQLWYSWTGRSEDRGCDLVTAAEVETGVVLAPPALLIRCIEGRQPVPLPSLVLVRRHVAEAVGGFEESFHGVNEVHEDLGFASKVLCQYPAVVTAEYLARHRQHPDNSGAFWARMGQYHLEQPHPPQGFYLRWLSRYLSERNVFHRDVAASLRRALWPYRHPALYRLSGWRRRFWTELRWRAQAGAIAAMRMTRRWQARPMGALAADPDPVRARDWAGTGVTTLSWTSAGPTALELRVGQPGGPLLSRSGASGRAITGNWVRDGMAFYLHDASDGRPATLATVLAALRVRVTAPAEGRRRPRRVAVPDRIAITPAPAGGADLASHAKGMAFLDGHGDIEDWGCGAGLARRFARKSRYIGVDGDPASGADRIADLRHYVSAVDCVFIAHVLEHSHHWRKILANAVHSFRRRMVLIISTAFGERTERLGGSPSAAPVIAFWKGELLEFFQEHTCREERVEDAPGAVAQVLYVEKRPRARR